MEHRKTAFLPNCIPCEILGSLIDFSRWYVAFPYISDREGSWNQSAMLLKQDMSPRLAFPPVDCPQATALIIHWREYFVPLPVTAVANKENWFIEIWPQNKFEVAISERQKRSFNWNLKHDTYCLTFNSMTFHFNEKQICPIQQIHMKIWSIGLKNGCVEINHFWVTNLRIKHKKCYFNGYITLFFKGDFFFLFISHRNVPEVKYYLTKCVSIWIFWKKTTLG